MSEQIKTIEDVIEQMSAAVTFNELFAIVHEIELAVADNRLSLSEGDSRQIKEIMVSNVTEMERKNAKSIEENEKELELLDGVRKLDPSVITVDFLARYDGSMAWIRDDYLSMCDINQEPKARIFLNRVVEVKAEARALGLTFTG